MKTQINNNTINNAGGSLGTKADAFGKVISFFKKETKQELALVA
jgi:hypothetical protein